MRNSIRYKKLSIPISLTFLLLAKPVFADEEQLVYGEDYFYAGALVPTCEVDVIREQGGKRADVFAANAGAVIGATAQEKISEKSCIDRLKDLAGSVNVAFPSSLFNEGIIDRLKDMACDQVDSLLTKALTRQRLALEAPYGYVGVDLGIKRGEGGLTTEDTGTITEKLEDKLLQETRRVINTKGREATRDLEDQAGINEMNREASKLKREGEIDINDSVRDGLDAL